MRLGETEYAGTLAKVPMSREQSLTREVVQTTAKRERGKVKGNKPNPRTRSKALDDCKVYANAEAYEAGEVSRVIPRRANSAEQRDRTKTERVISVARHHESDKQRFAREYREKLGPAI